MDSLREIIQQEISNYRTSFQTISVAPHVHNGSDSQQIPFKNLIVYPVNTTNNTVPTTDSGLALVNGTTMYNIYLLDAGSTAPLVIQPNKAAFDSGGATLYFGLSAPFDMLTPTPVVFNKIFMNVNGEANAQEITFEALDSQALTPLNDVGRLSISAGIVDMQTSDGSFTSEVSLLPRKMNIQATGDFAIQLPDTSRPSPIAGMIAFEAGTFYACEVTGTWKTIVTA